jgi:hypothetical protein
MGEHGIVAFVASHWQHSLLRVLSAIGYTQIQDSFNIAETPIQTTVHVTAQSRS